MAESLEELQQKTILALKILVMTGSMADFTGHVFTRVPGTDMFLTRCRNQEDISPAYVHAGAVRLAKLDGGPGQDMGDYIMPPERHIGIAVMNARPDINCVIHAHPPAQVLCSITDTPIRPIVGAQNPGGMRLVLDGVPLYDRSVLISDHDLGGAMMQTMGSKDICVLKAHGNVVAGRSVEEATVRAIILENIARMCWQVSLAGKQAPDISQADIDYFINFQDSAANFQTAGTSVRVGEGRTWGYYVRMLQEGARIPPESTVGPHM